MFDQIDFGKRAREFRTRNGYSQKEVALRIGVSEQAVSKWESGEGWFLSDIIVNDKFI